MKMGLWRILKQAQNWRELKQTPYGMRPLIVLSAISFFSQFDTAVFNLAAPDIVADLQIEITSIVTIAQIVSLILLFGLLGLGWYLDRHKRYPVLALGTIFSGVFSMVSSRAQGLLSLGIPRALDNVSASAASVPSFSLLADYYPPETRGKVFAFLGSLSRAGALIAGAVVGGLVVTWGWRPVTLVFGSPLVVLGIVALFALREPVRGYMEKRALGLDEETSGKEDEPLSFGEGVRTVFASRTLRRLVFASVLAESGVAIYSLFVQFFLADVYGLDAFQRGLISIPSTAAGLLAGYLAGGLIDNFARSNPGRILTLLGGFYAVGSLGLIGVASELPLPLLVAFVTVISFGTAVVGPAAGSVLSQVIPPSVRTQGLQVLNLTALPAIFIFLPVGGAILTEWGLNATIFAAVPLLVIGGLVAASAAPFFDVDRRSAMSAAAAAHDWKQAKDQGRAKLLVCRGIDVDYDSVRVLHGVDFDVQEGEIIALLGINGSGKSTLLKAISGIQEASSGAIVFDGRDITHMPPHEVAARGVVQMPGGRGVFPGLTVKENLMLGRWMTQDEPDSAARLHEVFNLFPTLLTRADTLAGSLSGGEQQQLSLAQTFLARPRLMLIDELSLGLSPAVVSQLVEAVKEINRRGVTVVVVEQSINTALRLASRAVFMEKGTVRFFGNTQDLMKRQDILRSVYVRGTEGKGVTSGVAHGAAVRRSGELQRARAALEVSGVSKSYGGVLAIDDVSLTLREGEVLGLIGPNGAGKTTLLEVISGYQSPDRGNVLIDGVSINALSPEQRAARKLIRRFQDARLFPSLSLHEALLVALDLQHSCKHASLSLIQARPARRAERLLARRAERLIELLRLEAYRDKLVGELSTGLRRIADLACVLASEPNVLLLDEPSTGIASQEVTGLAPLFRRVGAETGCSMIIIEHSMPLISAVSDRLIAMDAGRIIADGLPEEVLSNDAVLDSYLGQPVKVDAT